MLKEFTYHCYQNFNRKYDEIDEELFNQTIKGNLDYVIQTLDTYKTKLDTVYVAALLTSQLDVIKNLCKKELVPNNIPNIMNVAAAFSDYSVINFLLGLNIPLTAQVFDEAVNADRYNLLEILYSKNCPMDYEEILYIILHKEDTESSYYWLQTHVEQNKKIKTNELYPVLKLNLLI